MNLNVLALFITIVALAAKQAKGEIGGLRQGGANEIDLLVDLANEEEQYLFRSLESSFIAQGTGKGKKSSKSKKSKKGSKGKKSKKGSKKGSKRQQLDRIRKIHFFKQRIQEIRAFDSDGKKSKKGKKGKKGSKAKKGSKSKSSSGSKKGYGGKGGSYTNNLFNPWLSETLNEEVPVAVVQQDIEIVDILAPLEEAPVDVVATPLEEEAPVEVVILEEPVDVVDTTLLEEAPVDIVTAPLDEEAPVEVVILEEPVDVVDTTLLEEAPVEAVATPFEEEVPVDSVIQEDPVDVEITPLDEP